MGWWLFCKATLQMLHGLQGHAVMPCSHATSPCEGVQCPGHNWRTPSLTGSVVHTEIKIAGEQQLPDIESISTSQPPSKFKFTRVVF
ncbi:hypothetical protein V8C86DRAFT_3144470 [Haematococcus lacustris]